MATGLTTFLVMWILQRVVLLLFTLQKQLAEQVWEQDLSMDMQIGASTEGYNQITLRCVIDKMIVNVETPEDFSGVIYTQGSFYSRPSLCFQDPARGGNHTIIIPFDQCKTEKIGDKYKNIMIFQHDDELITPGDAAFALECDFSEPREITLSTDLNNIDEKRTRSSISLLDADPSRDVLNTFGYVESDTNEVIFMPNSIGKERDEL